MSPRRHQRRPGRAPRRSVPSSGDAAAVAVRGVATDGGAGHGEHAGVEDAAAVAGGAAAGHGPIPRPAAPARRTTVITGPPPEITVDPAPGTGDPQRLGDDDAAGVAARADRGSYPRRRWHPRPAGSGRRHTRAHTPAAPKRPPRCPEPPPGARRKPAPAPPSARTAQKGPPYVLQP